jgi:hypothetical protein
MPPRSPYPQDDQDPDWKQTVNLLATIMALLLLGAGYFLMDGVHWTKKTWACYEAGRRTCGETTSNR